MKTILWSILCLFLSGWGSMQTVSAQDLQEMVQKLGEQYTAVTIFTFSFEDMLREDSNISF